MSLLTLAQASSREEEVAQLFRALVRSEKIKPYFSSFFFGFRPPKFSIDENIVGINAGASQGSIVISRQVLQLSNQQIEAILSHELAHIIYKDYRFSKIEALIAFILTLAITLNIFLSVSNALGVVCIPACYAIYQLLAARAFMFRELRADSFAAKVVGKEVMRSVIALFRHERELNYFSRLIESLFAKFSTHPTFEIRLKNLS